MNKILILISLFLFSCTSGSNLVSENKINVGMSKTDLCGVLLWRSSPSEDACIGGSGSRKIGNYEIIWGSGQKYYYVLQNNKLIKTTNSFASAIRVADNKKSFDDYSSYKKEKLCRFAVKKLDDKSYTWTVTSGAVNEAKRRGLQPQDCSVYDGSKLIVSNSERTKMTSPAGLTSLVW